MESSLPTLEQIALCDNVDDSFRRSIINEKITFNLFACLAGACGVIYSVAESIVSGIDVERGLLAGISLTADVLDGRVLGKKVF